MHRRIKNFNLSGEFTDDSFALHTRVNAELAVNYMMRDAGYARVLDLDPVWSTYYNSQEDRWTFEMTMYGMYVGKRKAKLLSGIAQGKPVPRIMHQDISRL